MIVCTSIHRVAAVSATPNTFLVGGERQWSLTIDVLADDGGIYSVELYSKNGPLSIEQVTEEVAP